MEITLEDGKYVYVEAHGRQDVLRYDEPWRDVTGDKFIGAMASEIERLRAELATAKTSAFEWRDALVEREGDFLQMHKQLAESQANAARYCWLKANGRANEKTQSQAILGDRKRALVAFRYWCTEDELDEKIDSMLVSEAPKLGGE